MLFDHTLLSPIATQNKHRYVNNIARKVLSTEQ